MDITLQYLFISLISGIIHLDTMVLGQVMISRPIVTGPLIGFLLHKPEIGLMVGIIMELLYISIIPVGIKIPPDSTAATILSIICADKTSGIPISIFLGTIFALLYKFTDMAQRTISSIFLHWVDVSKPEFVELRVYLLTVYSLIITFFRSVLFYLLTLPIMGFIVGKSCYLIKTFNLETNFHNLVYILPAIGIGIGLSHFIEE